MRRILIVLTIALVMAAMVVVMSAPGLAGPCPNNPNHCENPGGQEKGNLKVFNNKG